MRTNRSAEASTTAAASDHVAERPAWTASVPNTTLDSPAPACSDRELVEVTVVRWAAVTALCVISKHSSPAIDSPENMTT
jgi:hypothetical protein